MKPNFFYRFKSVSVIGKYHETISCLFFSSNCVINLCKDKKKVLQEAYRTLKDGGELYFSDVYADRVLSDEIRSHEVLWGELVHAY